MSRLHIPALALAAALLLAFALLPVVFPNEAFRVALGDLVPLLAILAATVVSGLNARDSRGHTRLFWSLLTAGLAMWTFSQLCWTWFEVVLRRHPPDPFQGDVVLFLHVVPIMAAVAIRPHRADEREGVLPSALNVLTLLTWWVVVYAFFVFPEQYIVTNTPAYNLRWDALYFVEGMIMLAVSAAAYRTSSGSWRKLYRDILLATFLYAFASESMNVAIARGTYKTGSLYDLPFVAAVLGFLWVAVSGRRRLRDTEMTPPASIGRRPVATHLAKLAMLSLPFMAYWALFLSHEDPRLQRARFTVAMGGIALLAFVVFLKQYFLDQQLLQLLQHSRKSLDNLQRLQGRVIQQAKLASLGELVALAAVELEFPLSAILSSSERMAASRNLSAPQLNCAQKIGQQARRTRELVGDLLSFSQQTPGEKTALDLKPLLQRAIQMEGFKIENRKITLTVESREVSGPLPQVLGNANQLLQAFLQIVENAIEALQGASAGSVEILLWHEGGEVVVQIADSGPGLRDPARVFDPFYTTKPVGKGTGLGLSATWGVILDHKGHITAHNRPEGGAAFEVRLPALQLSAPFAEAARA